MAQVQRVTVVGVVIALVGIQLERLAEVRERGLVAARRERGLTLAALELAPNARSVRWRCCSWRSSFLLASAWSCFVRGSVSVS
jgi:hypothetical protein